MKKTRSATLLAVALVWLMIQRGSPFAEEPQGGGDLSVAVDSSRDPTERMAAMGRLRPHVGEKASGPLTEMLLNKTEEEGVRICAARVLGEIKAERSGILKSLEEAYKDPRAGGNLRYTILYTLGTMGDEGGLPTLREALTDPDPMIRFKAVQAMGNLGAREVIPLIIAHLESEKEKLVRAEGARALGKYDGEVSQRSLSRLLLSDPEAVVRLNAALTLLGYPAPSSTARSALASAKEDASVMVRSAVKGGMP